MPADLLYLDIETLQQDPYEWMVKPPEGLTPPKNWKDPAKIAEWIREASDGQVAELREKSSLEPILGGVICVVGIAVGDAEPKVLINATGDESGERVILTQLQTGLSRYPKHAIVSWNGAFDWSYLAKRAIRHGLYDLARRCYVAKPWGDSRHVDPGKAWQGPDNRSVWALASVARFLGIEIDDAIDGSAVTSTWHTEGGPAIVAAHCLSDVRILREITIRLVAAGWLDLEIPEVEIPIPPPRGSVDDLLYRAHRLQIDRRPDQIREAWLSAGGVWPSTESGQWAPVLGPRVEGEGAGTIRLADPEDAQYLAAYVAALAGTRP